VVQERYDLIIPEKYWEEEKIQALLTVIRSDEYQDAVRAMGGYELSRTGEVLF
jgi:putative molybdopterin biosynthesis protein